MEPNIDVKPAMELNGNIDDVDIVLDTRGEGEKQCAIKTNNNNTYQDPNSFE